MPRLKRIHKQVLWRPGPSANEAYSQLQPVLSTRAIQWDLIAQQYDEIVKYATAMRLGTADAEAILRRFTRSDVQHPTYAALAELGKVRKTIFLCNYLHIEELRREVHEALNVIENWNSANSFILYGKGGEIATNRLEEQELTILSLHLLQLCLVYVNTILIQKVLSEPQWAKRMTPEDLRGLTPLIYNHVGVTTFFQGKSPLREKPQFMALECAVPRIFSLFHQGYFVGAVTLRPRIGIRESLPCPGLDLSFIIERHIQLASRFRAQRAALVQGIARPLELVAPQQVDVPPAQRCDMRQQLIRNVLPFGSQRRNRIHQVDCIPRDDRRHHNHQATRPVHLILKGPIPHHATPAKEHGPPQRVRALMAIQAPLDPAPDGFIPIAFEQMQGLLNLANFGEGLGQLVLPG